MLRNVPVPLKIYAALAFLGALGALWRIVALLAQGGSIGRVFWELIWAGFECALAVGILQLRSWARVLALICCWFEFVVFGVVLACWCIWPHSVSVMVLVAAAAATTLNLYFYIVFRRAHIRAMFHQPLPRSL